SSRRRSGSGPPRSAARPGTCGTTRAALGCGGKRRRRRSEGPAARSRVRWHGTEDRPRCRKSAGASALAPAVRVYIDSDILIWHLRGERRATAMLRRLDGRVGMELWTGGMQGAEVVFFMRREEEQRTMSFLSRLRTQAVTQDIVDLAGSSYRAGNPSAA